MVDSNERYTGYCVDLIKAIAQVLEFKFTIKLVEDGKHGRKNERGDWNGMIKELIEGVIRTLMPSMSLMPVVLTC